MCPENTHVPNILGQDILNNAWALHSKVMFFLKRQLNCVTPITVITILLSLVYLPFICPTLEKMGFTFESKEMHEAYHFFKEMTTKAIEERKKQQKVWYSYTALVNGCVCDALVALHIYLMQV